MTPTKHRALIALADATDRPFLSAAPLMAIVEAVAVLDEAGLLIDPAMSSPDAVDAAIVALNDEGFSGRDIEAQVRALIVAWGETRRLRASPNPRAVALHALIQLHDLAGLFTDEALGQNSTRLRYQFQAQEGFEALGLDGIDAARAETIPF